MKYLKPYKILESDDIELVREIVKDATQDLSDEGFDIEVDETFASCQTPLVIIRCGRHFKFNEVKDVINELISQMDGIDYELESIQYSLSGHSTSKWYDVSMDPISGQVVGNTVIDIAHPNGRAVSKFPILKGVRIVFYER